MSTPFLKSSYTSAICLTSLSRVEVVVYIVTPYHITGLTYEWVEFTLPCTKFHVHVSDHLCENHPQFHLFIQHVIFQAPICISHDRVDIGQSCTQSKQFSRTTSCHLFTASSTKISQIDLSISLSFLLTGVVPRGLFRLVALTLTSFCAILLLIIFLFFLVVAFFI